VGVVLGNGITSALKSPSGTYAAAGTYTVTLIASNASGAGSVATRVITVTTPPVSIARIRSLSPDHGKIGTKVTIVGTGFGTPGVVRFGTVVAKVSSWAGTRIVVTVPSGHYRSSVLVTVTPKSSTASNAVKFSLGSHDGDDSRD